MREEKGGRVIESKVREALLIRPAQGAGERQRVGEEIYYSCVRDKD